MSEISDLNEVDSANTSVSGFSTNGATANMGTMDDVVQSILGMLKRWFKSSLFRLRDSTDQTKLLAFGLSGLTTATTRTLTVQDRDGTIALTDDIATKAEMEAGTSTAKFVTPGRQQNHPGHPKAWASVNQTGVQAIRASYNVSSITDTGVGRTQINFATFFSSGEYCSVMSTGSSSAIGASERVKNATALEVGAFDTAFAAADADVLNIICMGDQ